MISKKLFPIVLAILALATLFVACRRNTTSDPLADTSAPPEESTAPEDIYRMEQEFTYLSCISALDDSYFSPKLLALGKGTLLLVYREYEELSDSFVTALYTVDILSDKITAKKTIDGYMEVESACTDGFILEDSSDMSYRFFDSTLREVFHYLPPENGGAFSPDGTIYYFISAGKLWSADVATNEMTCIASEYGVRYSYIWGVSSDGSYLFADCNNFTIDIERTVFAGVEIPSSKTKILAYDILDPAMSPDRFSFRKFSYAPDGHIDTVFFTANSPDGNCPGFTEDKYVFSALENSDYVVCYDIESDTDLYVGYIDEDACKLSRIEGGYFGFYEGGFAYMPEEKLIAFPMTDDEGAKICILDTRLQEPDITLPATVSEPVDFLDLSISDKFRAAEVIPETPDYLAELRLRADALEETYGIKIYLSAQCRDMVASDKEYECTDTFFDDGAHSLEISLLADALDAFETVLPKYPDGFFAQFQTVTGDGGLRFCLIAGISDGYSSAFAIQTDEWYNMLFDVSYNITPNLPHELWHSTESFIWEYDYDLLSEELWSAFNPDGFSYTEEYETYTDIDDTYCFPYEEWYFIDAYSKVNVREDRARIMEVVMSPEFFDTDSFLASEHIREKLDAMCSAMRKAFDTDGWSDVFWERYGS